MAKSIPSLVGAVLMALSPIPVALAEGSSAPAPAELATPEPSAEPALPAGVEPGVPTLTPVPGDKDVLVIHAPASNRRAIVYLHGMCGNVRAVETWKAAAAQHGTLIGLLGDRACGGGRFKWSKAVEPIEARIERAVRAVRTARGGLLDESERILFGYSQGADRASVLARRFPGRYRRVVLGGPSHQPRLANLGETLAVAVFGGEFETTYHMRSGAEALSAAGKPARFFLLPSAKHGEYGPEGNRVIGEVLSWVVESPVQEAPSDPDSG
jgi:pimeloyl-ACP methyl ester carboxylesterase